MAKAFLVHCVDPRIQIWIPRVLKNLGIECGDFYRFSDAGAHLDPETVLPFLDSRILTVGAFPRKLILVAHEDCKAGKGLDELRQTMEVASTRVPNTQGIFLHLNGRWDRV